MTEYHFQFESEVSFFAGKKGIELAITPHQEVELEFTKNFDPLHLFQFLCESALYTYLTFERPRIIYREWLESELIQRAQQRISTMEITETLAEVIEEFDDRKIELREQMAPFYQHYQQSKSKLQTARLMRERFYMDLQEYPIVYISKSIAFILNATKFAESMAMDITPTKIMIGEEESPEIHIQGQAEISPLLLSKLPELMTNDPEEEGINYVISTAKFNTETIRLRRTATVLTRIRDETVDHSDLFLQQSIAMLVEQGFDEIFDSKVVFSRIQLKHLLELIKRHYHETDQVEIISSTNNTCGTMVVEEGSFYLNRDQEAHLGCIFKVHTLEKLLPMLKSIESCVLYLPKYPFPALLRIRLSQGFLNIYENVREQQFCRAILDHLTADGLVGYNNARSVLHDRSQVSIIPSDNTDDTFMQAVSNPLLVASRLLLEGHAMLIPSMDLIENTQLDEASWLASSLFLVAKELVDTYRRHLIDEEFDDDMFGYMVESKSAVPSVKLTRPLQTSCTCHGSFNQKICSHVLALVTAVYAEGLLEW